MLINAALFVLNVLGMRHHWENLGALHAITISCIITGLKPLINFVQFALFAWKAGQHSELLERLQKIQGQMHTPPEQQIPTSRWNRNAYFLALLCFVLLFFGRILDIIYKGESFKSFMVSISPVLVGLLSMWGLIPLMYFAYLTAITRNWFRTLRSRLHKDQRLRKRTLHAYFTQFKELAETVGSFQPVFGPFLAFSLAWSVLSVCLAVYFITQAPAVVTVPPETREQEEKRRILMEIYSDLIWLSLQVIVAMIFIFTICISGFRTNEEVNVCF